MQASFRGGHVGHDIVLFHIDTPAEDPPASQVPVGQPTEAPYFIILGLLAAVWAVVLSRHRIIHALRPGRKTPAT